MPSSNTALTLLVWIASRRSGWLGRGTEITLPLHFFRSARVKPAAFITAVTVNIVGLALIAAADDVTLVDKRRGKRSRAICSSDVIPVDLCTPNPMTS